jgi:uncharacterized membrane protein
MAKKKFDTNPLDPEFPERIREAQQTNALPKNDFQTGQFPPPSVTEEQTRRFEDANFNAYQAPFSGQHVPASYRPAKFAENVGNASKRKVARIGLPENIMTALPYLPIWIGLVIGLLILFFVPKSEAKVRFHAAQASAAHIAIVIISTILGNIGGIANFGKWIFLIVTTVMLLVFTIKALLGKPVHIEWVDDLTEWLEDKIKPRS